MLLCGNLSLLDSMIICLCVSLTIFILTFFFQLAHIIFMISCGFWKFTAKLILWYTLLEHFLESTGYVEMGWLQIREAHQSYGLSCLDWNTMTKFVANLVFWQTGYFLQKDNSGPDCTYITVSISAGLTGCCKVAISGLDWGSMMVET